ncbi:MAG: DNA repair protein RecO [Caldilineales bacterium]|nr:DNA repair protein RecO [Caldilineales bacterium]
MARERVYRTRAVVLKRRDHGEADRILTTYTPDFGKRVFLARGVRKPASRKAGHLEPFTHVNLLLAKGRTWDLVTQAETVYGFRPLREDLDRAAHAYYLAELIDAFTEEEDAHIELYDLLLAGLRLLEKTDKLALTTRWFELELLKLSGFQPEFFHCVECGDEIQPVTNYFSAELGGVLCPRHGEGRAHAIALDVGALKVLRYIQSQPYEQAERLELTDARMRQIERVLADYIRHVLERKLKTPDFIHRL